MQKVMVHFQSWQIFHNWFCLPSENDSVLKVKKKKQKKKNLLQRVHFPVHQGSSERGTSLKRKNELPLGANSFPSYTLFLKGVGMKESGQEFTKVKGRNSTKCIQSLRYENTPIQINWEFYHQKNENCQAKNSCCFHISAENIDCGYLLEPPRRGGSNEYPLYMFLSQIRKLMFYFYLIKVGLRWPKLYRRGFVMQQ